MVNGKTPLYLTLVAVGLFSGAMLLLQPYTADWPGTAYTKPAQRYVRAAIRGDSEGLVRMSASSTPVAWALTAARTHRRSLALWEGRVQAWTGERRGDTAEVFVYPPGEECEHAPIVFRFIGTGQDARVLQVSSSCIR